MPTQISITGQLYFFTNRTQYAAFNGATLTLTLNVPAATVIGGGAAPTSYNFTLVGSQGVIPGTPGGGVTFIWANDQLSPAGTYYVMTVNDSGGNQMIGPTNLFIISGGVTPIDIDNLVPPNPVSPPHVYATHAIEDAVGVVNRSFMVALDDQNANWVHLELDGFGIISYPTLSGTGPIQIVKGSEAAHTVFIAPSTFGAPTWRLLTTADLPAGGSPTYIFTQSSPATTWNINHNLGKYPSITVVDSSGNVVNGQEQYVDNNNITLTFGSAFGGLAYLN